jgi:hypothetical protein
LHRLWLRRQNHHHLRQLRGADHTGLRHGGHDRRQGIFVRACRSLADSGLVQDRRKSLFSVPMMGSEPADYAAIKSENQQEQGRERVSLWYVAATRARDLLVLPRHTAQLPDKCWAKILDLGLADLNAIDRESLGARADAAAKAKENGQTREIFAGEADRIAKATRKSFGNGLAVMKSTLRPPAIPV